jgi:hypothetical protein
MSSPDIREIIATAVEQENATHNLLQRLRDNIPQLTSRLELPEDAPEQALLEFITSYIESVPGCISLVTAVSKQFGLHDYVAPFLHIAEDYFLQPPDEVPETGGLALLLDEAFLAHRLLEEVNDHHIRHVQRPLLPLDMTEANIIVHHLLGEPLAGRLEQLVQYTASRLLEKVHVWDKVRKIPRSTAITMPLMSSLNRRTHSVRLRLIPTA